MRQGTRMLLGPCLLVAAAAGAQTIDLDDNWNGIVHDGEQTTAFADSANGFRSISDRGIRLGTANALGGNSFSITTTQGTYNFVNTANQIDMVMIGTREANGQLGWDATEDGDNIGDQPSWDPTGGTAVVTMATTNITPITAGAAFKLSCIFNGSIGGGDFDLTLHFADATSVTVTLNSPDWFANFDPTPPPAEPGVASLTKLAGPVSNGDGFLGVSNVDWVVPGEPLAVFEGTITATSLSDGLGFNIVGKTLNSVTFDATNLIGVSNASIGIYGLAINGANRPLAFNWNGMAQPAEVAPTKSDAPNGYRSIGDRGLFAGEADSLGGTSFTVASANFSYDIESQPNVVDMVMIGTRPDGFDDTVDGDAIGVAPAWDPSGGGALVIDSTTNVNVPLDSSFQMGILYHASNGGGSFEVHLNFADGDDVTVTLDSPDWFADGNPVPPAPNPGVASQVVLPGPLSLGDGFLATGSTDLAILDAPLSVFEAAITAESLNDDLGFNVNGRTLTSINFDAINLLLENPNAAVGIFGVSLGGGCFPDCDGNGTLNILDFVCFQLAFQAGDSKADCDGNGVFNILDFVCFQLAFQAGCE